jgi:hypothetical protein
MTMGNLRLGFCSEANNNINEFAPKELGDKFKILI